MIESAHNTTNRKFSRKMKIQRAKFQVRTLLLKCYLKVFHKLQILLINLIVSGLEGPQKKLLTERSLNCPKKNSNNDGLVKTGDYSILSPNRYENLEVHDTKSILQLTLPMQIITEKL